MEQVQQSLQEMQEEYAHDSQQQKHQPDAVLFHIGDIIRHKRYHYRGVVVDWDITCSLDEAWMRQMGVGIGWFLRDCDRNAETVHVKMS